MPFSIRYINKDSGASMWAPMLHDPTRENMEQKCRKLVDEGHRDVRLVELRCVENVVKRFNETDDSNDRLKSENAKLREVLLDLADLLGKNVNLRELYEENTNLRSENERLRKLILDIWNDAIRFDDFWDYVMDDGELYNEDELPHYQERMKKLGIKVN